MILIRAVKLKINVDADLNAAINIKQNYILSLANKEQAVVNQPNVAGIS